MKFYNAFFILLVINANLFSAEYDQQKTSLDCLTDKIDKENHTLKRYKESFLWYFNAQKRIRDFSKKLSERQKKIIVTITDPANKSMALETKIGMMEKHFSLQDTLARQLLRDYQIIQDPKNIAFEKRISMLQQEIKGLEIQKWQIIQQYDVKSLPAIDNPQMNYPYLAYHKKTWHAHGKNPRNVNECLCGHNIKKHMALEDHIYHIEKFRSNSMHGMQCPECKKTFAHNGSYILHIRKAHDPCYKLYQRPVSHS